MSTTPSDPDSSARNATAPADGERRALRGYVPQLKVAAAHILNAFEQGTLEAIAVADPEAGRVDDLQMVTAPPGGVRVDAFQVKWSRDAAPVADAELRGLIADAVVGRAGLRDAWARRRDVTAPPVGRVVVHLHTNRPLSTAALRGEAVRGRGLTLPRFVSEVWRPATHRVLLALDDVPEVWREYVAGLAGQADVTVPELLDAAADIVIETDRVLPEETDDLRPGRRVQFLRDVNAVVLGLLGAVTDSRDLVVIEALPFLELVGEDLADRWRPRSTHNFPVPPDFQPMAETEHALELALADFTQGYVFLTGSPGSGKSTLLTSKLAGDPRVVARYYAFVPGNDTATRGEAHALMQDLLLAIDRRERLRTLAPSRDQLPLLRERFSSRLAELGARARAAASVAIIAIDGLDHVLRDPAPERPLLDELLPADEVPEGVLFVLGTRNTEDLPPRLQPEARLPGRHIHMAPMSRTATLALAEHANLTPNVAARVWQVSEGHPLLARTFTKLAAGCAPEDALTALASIQPLDGEAMRYYDTVWSDLQDDDELAVLLGLVCRLRGPIDLGWLQAGGSSAASIERLGRLEHLFRPGSGRRWSFFHDSFREFLRNRTSLRLGVTDQAKERELHAELARRCAATPPEEPQAWEEPHHLLRAGEPAAALARTTPEFFRRQMLGLRPPDDVLPDVREVAAALADEHDAVATIRLTLAAAECRSRDYHQSVNDEFLRVLVDLGHEDAALAHLRHVSDNMADSDRTTVAMRFAITLHDRQRTDEAVRVFGEYEPLELLSNRTAQRDGTAAHRSVAKLYAWAAAAVLIHGPEYVSTQADRIALTRSDLEFAQDLNDAAEQVHSNILWSAANCSAHRDHDADALIGAVRDPRIRDHMRADTLLIRARSSWNSGDRDESADLLDRALDGIRPGALDDRSTIAAAELLFRLNRPIVASAWIDALTPIAVPGSPTRDDDDLEWRLLLKRLRLHAALDGALEPVDVFPDDFSRHEHFRVIVARHLVVLSNLWARQLRGEQVTTSEITAVVRRVFGFWDHGSQRDRMDLWSALGGRRVIVEATIGLAGASGRAALRELWAWWEERWAQPTQARSGGLEAIEAFATAGIGAVSTRERLRRYSQETESDPDADPSTWVEIASAWLGADDEDAAHDALSHAQAASFTIGFRKDYQLTTWVRLLRPLLHHAGGKALAEWLIDRIVELNERAETGAAEDAAGALLEVVGAARPGDVLPLGLRLRERGVLDVDDLVHAALDALAATAGDVWWTVTAEILVPIGGAPVKLPRACAAAPDRATLARRMRAVADRVAVEGRPSDRRSWRRSLIAAAESSGLRAADLGIVETDLAIGDETPTRTATDDADDRQEPAGPLTLNELRARVQVTDDEHYTKHAAELAVAELEAGDRDEAWHWARQALERSAGRDWNRIWDGGPRSMPRASCRRSMGLARDQWSSPAMPRSPPRTTTSSARPPKISTRCSTSLARSTKRASRRSCSTTSA